jgi:hypothetical protein
MIAVVDFAFCFLDGGYRLGFGIVNSPRKIGREQRNQKKKRFQSKTWISQHFIFKPAT